LRLCGAVSIHDAGCLSLLDDRGDARAHRNIRRLVDCTTTRAAPSQDAVATRPLSGIITAIDRPFMCLGPARRCDHDAMRQIDVQAAPLEMLGALLTRDRSERLLATATRARALLAGGVGWNVNGTAHGGGVAEMLQALLAYARGAGVDARWLVLDADPEFFAITKRVHNALHGALDAGSDPGASEHEQGTETVVMSASRPQARS